MLVTATSMSLASWLSATIGQFDKLPTISVEAKDGRLELGQEMMFLCGRERSRRMQATIRDIELHSPSAVLDLEALASQASSMHGTGTLREIVRLILVKSGCVRLEAVQNPQLLSLLIQSGRWEAESRGSTVDELMFTNFVAFAESFPDSELSDASSFRMLSL